MAHKENSPFQEKPETPAEPGFLRGKEDATQSIDLDRWFQRDVTDSGSFDLRRLRDVSFGKLLEAIPIPTILIDSTQKVQFANAAMNRVTGSASSVVGALLWDLFIEEDDRIIARVALSEIFTDRKTRVLEGMFKLGNEMLWCRVHLRSIRFKNQRAVIALVEDLTAEKRQLVIKEKYERLVQIFPIGIAEFVLKRPVSVLASVDDTLSGVAEAELSGGNFEFAGILGQPDIAGLKGTPLMRLIPFGGIHEAFYRTWIHDRFPAGSFETKEKTLAGFIRYFENTLVGNVKNNHLTGIWGMRQDITSRKEIESALRAARDKLEDKVRERTSELLQANEQLQTEIQVRRRAEEELAELVNELQQALAKVKTLSGLLPICASCKKIRDDRGYWTQVEVYVRDHSEADFTHSICPECAARLYPDFFDSEGFGRR